MENAGKTGVMPQHQICKKAQYPIGLFYDLSLLDQAGMCIPNMNTCYCGYRLEPSVFK